MKKFSVLSLLLFVGLLTVNCSSGNSSSSANTPQSVLPTQSYTLSSVTSQGVDDSGNMWLQLSGIFSPNNDNTLSLTCDGNVLSPGVQSQSSSVVVVSVPAASLYNDCSFTILAEGFSSNSIDTPITAMNISGTSNEVLDANPALVDLEIDGNFFAVPLVNSILSVLATCDGGNTFFSPNILSQSINVTTQSNAVVISLNDPGSGNQEQCSFTIQDSFTDEDQNITIVSSPTFTATVTGI